MKQVKSSYNKLNWRDILHAFIMAFVTSSLTGIIELMQSGHLPTFASVKVHAVIGLTAGLSYVLKVLKENSNGQLFKKEDK